MIGRITLGGQEPGKIPKGAGIRSWGRSLQGTGFGSRKIPPGIKRTRKNSPEDFRQGEFSMKEMSVVRDSLQEK